MTTAQLMHLTDQMAHTEGATMAQRMTVKDEDGHLSTVIVHAHSDDEARDAAEATTGGWAKRVVREG